MYGTKIRSIRERYGITERKVAEYLGISYSLYCDYENENQIMPIKHLNKVCNYLNISFDYLFGFTDIIQYKNNTKEYDIKVSARRLKEFRKENKLTQMKLSDMFKTGKGTFANYECARNIIATPFLYDICKKYYISADYLLGRTNEPIYLKQKIQA